jgi:DNA-binding CsgD family transcriptional regulator
VYVSVIKTKQATDRMLVHGGDSENSSTRVLLIMSSGHERASPAPGQLIVMFDLSPTEARLAHQLSRGVSINEYAENFCVSVATVRTQLRAVLRKTGTSRQQDLIRMLATIPVISQPTT